MADPLSRRVWALGATWLSSGQAAGLLISAFVAVILARALGPGMFGVYSVITASVSLTVTVVTWRLDTHLAATLGRDTDPQASLVHSVNAAYLIGVPVLIAAVLGLLTVPLDGTVRAAGLVGAAEVLVAPMLFHRAVLQVRHQQRQIVAAALSGRALWAVIILVAVAAGMPSLLLWAVVGRLTGSGLEAALLSRTSALRTDLHHLLASFDRTASISVLQVSWPLAASGIAGVAYNRSDQLLLAGMRGTVDTGLYAAGVRLAEMLNTLPAVVQSVVLPGAVVAHEQSGLSGLAAVVRDGLVLMLIPGGLGIAALVSHGEPLAVAVLGAEYEGAGRVLSLLAVAELPIFLGAALTTAALALNTRTVLAIATLAGLGCNLLLNLIAIPALGAVGAALTSVLAYTLVAAITAMANPGLRMIACTLVSPTARSLLAIVTSVLVTRAVDGLLPGLLTLSGMYLTATLLLFPHEWQRARKALARRTR